MERMNKIDYYMNIAFAVSLRSTCMRRKVGSIIVKDNRILSTGYNGSPHGMENCISNPNLCYRSKHNIPSGKDLHLCRANHSEVNAIMSALKTGEDLKGAAIYVTTSPCSNCAKMIIQSGINEVYYIEGYEDIFSISLFKEAGITLTKVNGSKFRAPEGESHITVDDMDTIDPLVAQIYKYQPGTEIFALNREKIMKENGLFERYDEMIYYTHYNIDKEIVPITNDLYNKIGKQVANRNTLEYNGDAVKQLTIGAVVYDIAKDELIVLKCLGERFAGKFTMIQGHMAVDKKDTPRSKLKTIMMRNLRKEVTEELNLKFSDILEIEPLYLIQTNDNRVSSEHMGVISLIKIDTDMLDYKIESGEPEKHEVAHLTKYDLSNMDLMGRYDTWLKKVIIKMKEDNLI